MKFCNDCAVPESSKCVTVECPPACDGSEQSCPCFKFDCFKAGKTFHKKKTKIGSETHGQWLICRYKLYLYHNGPKIKATEPTIFY